jgi:hypothetical protein
MQHEELNVGSVVTDHAGNCGRARRILGLRWPKMMKMILSCFAHQINLLVIHVINASFKEIAKQAYDIVACFNKSTAK